MRKLGITAEEALAITRQHSTLRIDRLCGMAEKKIKKNAGAGLHYVVFDKDEDLYRILINSGFKPEKWHGSDDKMCFTWNEERR